MQTTICGSAPLRGKVSVPPDKAICHRAVLAAALAEGRTRVHPWPDAEDCKRTLEVVKGLGIVSERSDGAVVLTGAGRTGFQAPLADLACGESGTTLRLAAGVLASQPFRSRLTALPSLARRPMQRIVTPLVQMGAAIEGAHDAGRQGLIPPLTITGRRPLRAIRFQPPVASAQVKSAVLFAGLAADGPTTVSEPIATRDHTERMLSAFGAQIDTRGREVTVRPGSLVSPGEAFIPGDISSAAFFIVAGLIVPGSQVELMDVGLNPSRSGFLSVLARMGAVIDSHVEKKDGEPCGRIRVSAQQLTPVEILPQDVPAIIDELPILMVAAAYASGVSTFRGLAELRVKVTDRIASMVAGLRALGTMITEPEPDSVRITGGAARGGAVNSANDHRTAMSLAVAALGAQGRTVIEGSECVRKSYPDFFTHLSQVAGSGAVE